MIKHFEQSGDKNVFEYKHRTIVIWKETTEYGRRIKRRYRLRIDDRDIKQIFRSPQQAFEFAREAIEWAIAGRWYEDQSGAFHRESPHIPATPDAVGRNSELREKLKNMTVERGCTEAEAAIARRKLAELDGKPS